MQNFFLNIFEKPQFHPVNYFYVVLHYFLSIESTVKYKQGHSYKFSRDIHNFPNPPHTFFQKICFNTGDWLIQFVFL